MKINEVESLAGITKKNIRFYEDQGLLSPRRNADNGYRDYSPEDIKILLQIKLLRKLGVPIEEIRQMQSGSHTVGDGMRRHLVSLERDRANLDQSILLCQRLQSINSPLSAFDAESLLSEMTALEQEGASFQNKHTQDVRIHYVMPVLITIFMVGFMITLVALLLWTSATAPAEAPPWWFLAVVIVCCLTVAVCVILALTQRIREIEKGEINDAKHY